MMIQEREDVRLERSPKEVWNQVLDVLSQKLPKPTFETWIRPTKLVELSGSDAVIGVTNDFMRSWIVNYHQQVITESIVQVLKRRVSVRVVLDPSMELEGYTPSIGSISVVSEEPEEERRSPNGTEHGALRDPGRPDAAHRIQSADLNPEYHFDSFVVSSHNRFSHSAALAVADKPGQAYNPLFIYGGVGLGKTHIMQAIGHHILKHSPHLSVRYLSCERFTNELIKAIGEHRQIEFRKRYRQVDVLLVDDIQFIEGKESTQEEFFHTFNALRDSGRQIVISSDRPPKALSRLEERLRSRFEWGLISDIQPPDLETRLAILHKKCELQQLAIPNEVLEYIASIFTNNVRELEGALTNAHAYARLTGSPLTVQALRSILRPGGPTRPRAAMTMEMIIDAVAAHYKVEPSEIRSSRRSQDLALPRHVAMYLGHEVLQMSYPRIGQAFGRKHTSALYAYEKIKEQIPADAELRQAVSAITRQLEA